MWVDAGFEPDSFWHQSPRTFQVSMAGGRKRMEREAEAQFRLAYETAALVATAQAGKLKKFEHYVKPKVESVASPERLVATLQAMGGGTMKVRKVKRGES